MHCYILENAHLKIVLSSLGASWLSCQVKLPTGAREVLVTTTPTRWAEQTAYFGATIGRYANRIANARYSLHNHTYSLAANHGTNNLHGGLIGADKKIWKVEQVEPTHLCFSTTFADGEEGFGGNVTASVEYRLANNKLWITFNAVSDQDTPLCLTNHAYFNLAGSRDIRAHQLQLNADYYLPVDCHGIPNAPLKAVEGNSFDFRQRQEIGSRLLADADQQAVKGYDHAFQLKDNHQTAAQLSVADLQMRLCTSMPALQVYTGNWLGGQPNLSGGAHSDYAGVALEPEFFPDTPNHPEWWQFGGISRANAPYHHWISYEFDYYGEATD